MRNIILASSSPRRKALLEQIGLKFTVDPGVTEADDSEGLDPARVAMHLSIRKAESVTAKYPDSLVLGADTLGVIDDMIIGKPHSESEAKDMLTLLQGRSHKVITGFSVVDTGSDKASSQSVETIVTLRKMSVAEIDAYVKTGEPLDKAGAYAIQGLGAVFVEKIEGDYNNVIGLPLFAVVQVLQGFGVTVF